MSNDGLHVDWKKLKQMGWHHSPETTNRMVSKGRFPKPFRFGATDCRAVWRLREVRPFVRRPFLAQR
jgi:hypothetical protein